MERTLEFSLDKIQGGAVPFLVDRAMRNVLDNILDENTDPKAKRGITIKIAINPSEDRMSAACAVTVTESLEDAMPVPTTILFGRTKAGALKCQIQQMDMFDDADDTPQLVTARKDGEV